MQNITDLIESLHLDTHLSLKDIPDIDLYMDQVIQLFENKYEKTKRSDEEKILTKTMINNYAKGKLFFPIHNKKYSREHLLLISIIYQLKGTLSINDIKESLTNLNEKIVEDDVDLEALYTSYLQLLKNNSLQFQTNTKEIANEVKNKAKEIEGDENYLEQLLLLATFVNMSNFYRRAAEKIVDTMSKK